MLATLVAASVEFRSLVDRGWPEETMPTFKLYWSPEGKQIATVDAPDRKRAIRKAPKPYRAALGEIYAIELLVTRHVRIFTVQWWSDGKCVVTSSVNGALVGTWDHGAWYGAHNDGIEVPEDVQMLATACKPVAGEER